MSRLLALLVFVLAMAPAAQAASVKKCMRNSGGEARSCFKRSLTAIEACRAAGDAECEAALRAEDGVLSQLQSAAAEPISRACSDDTALPLGYSSGGDVVTRVVDACADFVEASLQGSYGEDPSLPATAEAQKCQEIVVKNLSELRRKTLGRFGPRCFLRQIAGDKCKRKKRDRKLAELRVEVQQKIARRCGDVFDDLGLSELDPGKSTLDERIQDLVDRSFRDARHLAQLVYPPSDLGPDSEFGPYPIGVQTLALSDASRQNVGGDGPRPVVTEVYYPSTAEAVEGLTGDIVQVFGIDIVETPAFRDVAIADGEFPLIVFSHGNNAVRFQSFYFAAHLASHGYIVVSPDHHGNHFVDTLAGTVDSDSGINRPLDMSFLIDSFVAFDALADDFFEGAIDEDAIGASGHSFGGYTTWALAGPGFSAGTFTDPRVKAILPQAPASGAFPDSFFQAIKVPTLVIGGTIDETTPFPSNQQAPFEQLPSGASVVALAEIVDGGHFTFSDYCEVPRDLLSFLGGFDEACEPRHLPWRHAHDIANTLSLNFFDGTLKNDAGDLAKLTEESLAGVEDLVFTAK